MNIEHLKSGFRGRVGVCTFTGMVLMSYV